MACALRRRQPAHPLPAGSAESLLGGYLAGHGALPKTGEPVVRYMEYEFPHEGLETVQDQFMVGSCLLVAPLLEKDKWTRKVYVPKGRWQYGDSLLDSQGEWKEFSEKESCLIVLKELEDDT